MIPMMILIIDKITINQKFLLLYFLIALADTKAITESMINQIANTIGKAITPAVTLKNKNTPIIISMIPITISQLFVIPVYSFKRLRIIICVIPLNATAKANKYMTKLALPSGLLNASIPKII